MRAQPRWGVLPLLAAPVGTWALGLGEIELQSALNQPFRAQITLVSPTPEDIQGLSVTLANAATFDRYGLDRPAFLTDFDFRVGRDSAGRDVILVSSLRSVAEPFVTLLVEASWPSGRSLREYTVLLDPPLLLPEPAVPAPVQPAQSRAPEPSVAGGEIRRPAPVPEPSATPAPAAPAATAPTPPVRAPVSTSPAAISAAPVSPGGTYGPVQRLETLWGIAERLRPGNVTMNQMMVAVYQANPQAFDNNMNLLRRGAILRIPELTELQSVSASDATAEFRRQLDVWQGASEQQARLRLVTPPDESVAITTRGGQAAPAASNAAELDGLRNQVDTLQSDLAESRRLLELRNQELLELQNRLSESAAPAVTEPVPPVPAADPGVDLESEQLFTDELPAEPVEQAEPEAAPVTPVQPATTVPAVTTSPEPSLLSRLIGLATSPTALMGLGVGVLLLAALLFMRRRREEVEDVTGRWEALEAEAEVDDQEIAETTRIRSQGRADDLVVVEQRGDSEDAADALLEASAEDDDFGAFTGTGTAAMAEEPEASDETLSSQTVINLDQADPIAEADFHMAYGLYDQAAELVAKALEVNPESRSLKLKLLEVFFVWGNKESFLDAAQSLRQEMGAQPSADWDKVIIMGKQICPDDALFADATAAAGEVDLDLEAGDAPALDLAFDAQTDADAEIDLNFDAGDSAPMSDDLELETTGNRDQLRAAAVADDGLDLDIGAQTQAGLDAALFGLGKEDEASATTPDLEVDIDSLAATQESPTVETARTDLDDDWSGATMESPTIETSGPASDTVEMPSRIGEADSPTVESPTVETEPPLDEPPTVEQTGLHASGAELTAELDLDDLGLDVKDLDDLPSDLGDLPSADAAVGDTREQPALDIGEDDDLLSATGVTQVLQSDADGLETLSSTAVLADDQATMLAPGLGGGGESTAAHTTLTGTEVLEQVPGGLEDTQGRRGIDLDLDDLSEALEGGDTVEQPRTSSFGDDVFAGGQTPVDLDVGAHLVGSDDPTGTEEVGPLDAQTMTEVGTKLDLARAYIDMGDPEGARSILEEVLDEGDTGQRQEAETLIEVLSA